MYEFNRMSFQELLNAVIASEATPGMQSSRASVNDSLFRFVREETIEDVKAVLHFADSQTCSWCCASRNVWF